MNTQLRDWQLNIFEKIKQQIPPHLNLVFELSEFLQLSENSVYKRIRGEQLLTIEEFVLLKTKFQFIDLPTTNSESILKSFQVGYINIDCKQFSLLNYIESLIYKLQTVKQYPKHTLYYAAKDLPVFYFFIFPEIAAFKFYTWKRSVFYLDEYKHKKFNLIEELNANEISLGRALFECYSETNSIEIWGEETLNSLICQIEYSYSIGMFKAKEDCILLLHRTIELIDFIAEQTAKGTKKTNKEEESGIFEMYFHEMLLYDNSALANTTLGKIAFITHNTSNIIQIEDEKFCNQSLDYLQKLIFHSTPLSKSNEKSRLIFFNNLRTKVISLLLKVKD